jgi:hypothetical protein
LIVNFGRDCLATIIANGEIHGFWSCQPAHGSASALGLKLEAIRRELRQPDCQRYAVGAAQAISGSEAPSRALLRDERHQAIH